MFFNKALSIGLEDDFIASCDLLISNVNLHQFIWLFEIKIQKVLELPDIFLWELQQLDHLIVNINIINKITIVLSTGWNLEVDLTQKTLEQDYLVETWIRIRQLKSKKKLEWTPRAKIVLNQKF